MFGLIIRLLLAYVRTCLNLHVQQVYSLLAKGNGSTVSDAFVDDDKDVDQTRTLRHWQNKRQNHNKTIEKFTIQAMTNEKLYQRLKSLFCNNYLFKRKHRGTQLNEHKSQCRQKM